MSETDELVCLFNGNAEKPPCFTPIRLEPGQTEATCPTYGTRHILEEGRWKRVRERLEVTRWSWSFPKFYRTVIRR